jgi:hypothetical protein
LSSYVKLRSAWIDARKQEVTRAISQTGHTDGDTTEMTPQAAHGFNRRTLLKRGALVVGGAAVVAIASPTFAGVARADTYGTQLGWAWCGNCMALYYGPNESSSVCPAGVGFTHYGYGSVSYDYGAYYNYSPVTSNPQQQWRWCYKCQGFFYGPQQSQSHCPAGGAHSVSSSYNYAVWHDIYPEPEYQGNWNWCNKCRGLFYHEAKYGGVCPDGGAHSGTGSYDYFIPIAPNT